MEFAAFTSPAMLVAIVLMGLIAVFLTEWLRADIAAMGAVALLLSLGVLQSKQVVGALSNSALLTITSFFIISAALGRTGCMEWIGQQLARLSRGCERRLLFWMIVSVLAASPFINNTPLVMVMIPVVTRLAQQYCLLPSQLLIPLSYAAILGGTLTMTGTTTNILTDGVARELGVAPFSMFEVTLPALLIAGVGALLMWWLAPHLLPRRDGATAMAGGAASGHHAAVPGLMCHEGGGKMSERQAPLAFIVLAAVMVLSALQVMPIESLAMIGATVLIVSGCIRVEEVYNSIEWSIIILIFAMLALSDAMRSSGLVSWLVELLMWLGQDCSPWWLLIWIILLTSLMTEMISNHAVTVIMTPVVIALAEQLNIDARPFVVGVMFAASASFVTPVGYQTNMLVYGAGHYRFSDFARLGVPLNLWVWISASALIPLFWPFSKLS